MKLEYNCILKGLKMKIRNTPKNSTAIPLRVTYNFDIQVKTEE